MITFGECVICFEDLLNNIGVLKCGHTFHFDCIRLWITKTYECPICRCQCKLKNLVRLFLEDDGMNWFNIAQELEEMLEKTGKELKSANKDIAILSENFKELEKRCQMLEADNGSLVEKLNRLNPRFRSKTRTQRKKTFTSGLTSSARSTKRPRKNCSIEPRGKELKFDHY